MDDSTSEIGGGAMMPAVRILAAVVLFFGIVRGTWAAEPVPSTFVRGTGDLGIVVERVVGSVKIVETGRSTKSICYKPSWSVVSSRLVTASAAPSPRMGC